MFFIRSSGLGPLGLQTTQVFFSNLTNDFVSLSLKKRVDTEKQKIGARCLLGIWNDFPIITGFEELLKAAISNMASFCKLVGRS